MRTRSRRGCGREATERQPRFQHARRRARCGAACGAWACRHTHPGVMWQQQPGVFAQQQAQYAQYAQNAQTRAQQQVCLAASSV